MDDDDFADRGKKTNASHIHKPKHGKQYDVAPTGSVGRDPAGPPTPGLGAKGRGQALDQSTEPRIQFRRNPKQSQAKDDRPIAVETGIKEIDQDSKDKGYQLKTEDEIKKRAHPVQEKAEDTPERSGDQFRETNDREVNEFREYRKVWGS